MFLLKETYLPIKALTMIQHFVLDVFFNKNENIKKKYE